MKSAIMLWTKSSTEPVPTKSPVTLLLWELSAFEITLYSPSAFMYDIPAPAIAETSIMSVAIRITFLFLSTNPSSISFILNTFLDEVYIFK